MESGTLSDGESLSVLLGCKLLQVRLGAERQRQLHRQPPSQRVSKLRIKERGVFDLKCEAAYSFGLVGVNHAAAGVITNQERDLLVTA